MFKQGDLVEYISVPEVEKRYNTVPHPDHRVGIVDGYHVGYGNALVIFEKYISINREGWDPSSFNGEAVIFNPESLKKLSFTKDQFEETGVE